MTISVPMIESTTPGAPAVSARKGRAPLWYRAAILLMAAWGFLAAFRTLAARDEAEWGELSAPSPFELPWDLPHMDLTDQTAQTFVAVTIAALAVVAVGLLLAALTARMILIPFVAGAVTAVYYLASAVADVAAEYNYGLGEAIRGTVWPRDWSMWSPERYLNPAFVAMAVWLIVCLAGIAIWMHSRSRRRRSSRGQAMEQPVAMEAVDGVPAGWYQAAESETLQRWWDGSDWTERTRPCPPSLTTADGPQDAPGWYPDPQGRPVDRYWTGSHWDDRTRPRMVAAGASTRITPAPVGNGAATLNASVSVLVATRRLLRQVDALQDMFQDKDEE